MADQHVKYRYDFLKYLCGEDGSSVLPKYGMLPAYSGDEAKEAFREVVGKDNIVDVAFNAKKYWKHHLMKNTANC